MPGGEKLGRQPGENKIRPEDQAQSGAVDQVDQSGETQSPDGKSLTGGGSEEKLPLSGGQALMEQWLDQVEGDPAQLLRQQFRLEEYKYRRNQAGREQETRPW